MVDRIHKRAGILARKAARERASPKTQLPATSLQTSSNGLVIGQELLLPHVSQMGVTSNDSPKTNNASNGSDTNGTAAIPEMNNIQPVTTSAGDFDHDLQVLAQFLVSADDIEHRSEDEVWDLLQEQVMMEYAS
jgi:hypothetical protein